MSKRGVELAPLSQAADKKLTGISAPRTTVVFDLSGLPEGFPVADLGVNLEGTHKLLRRAGIGLGFVNTGDSVPFEPMVGRLDPVMTGVDPYQLPSNHLARWSGSILPVGQSLEDRPYTPQEAAQILDKDMRREVVRQGVYNLTTGYSRGDKIVLGGISGVVSAFGLGIAEYVASNPVDAGLAGLAAYALAGIQYNLFSRSVHKSQYGHNKDIRSGLIAGTELPGVATLLYEAKRTKLIRPLPVVNTA